MTESNIDNRCLSVVMPVYNEAATISQIVNAVVAQPILDGRAAVVFGSRFIGSEMHRVLYFWHAVGNRFLTLLSNMATNLNLTDMECGFKAFRREVFQKIELRENAFGFEPEITAKVARLGVPI